MSALTSGQRASVYLHLRAMAVNWAGRVAGGLPYFTFATHVLETAMDTLTDTGVTVVTQLLTDLDTVRTQRVNPDNSLLKQVREVVLRDDAPGAVSALYEQLCTDLLNVLGIHRELLSPVNGGGGLPQREP